VEPIAILRVEDRNGKLVIDNERDLRLAQRQKGAAAQIISPQTAFVMTQLLKKTVEIGTLSSGAGYGAKFTFVDENAKRYQIEAAGKTGTTQNWSDAWTVGFTPYYTTAVWFGFDKPGNSLGLSLTGATLAGPVWGDFMREVHMGLPAKSFSRPQSGVVDVTVCAKSGQLLTPQCNSGAVTLTFLEGTSPHEFCTLHSTSVANTQVALDTMRSGIGVVDTGGILGDLRMPRLNMDILNVPIPRGMPQTTPVPTLNLDDGYDDFDILPLPEYNPLTD
jgi:penicillin-binding protein 1A